MLAPTLAGHAGGPPIEGEITDDALADGVERAMDEAGIATAHIVGNSLGGYIALQLAARGRAESVVALAPAGGWAAGDDAIGETMDFFVTMRSPAPGRRSARRSDPLHTRGPAPRDRLHDDELRAHPGRAPRPRNARDRPPATPPSRSSITPCARAGASTRSGSPARSGSSGGPATGSCNGPGPRPATATTGSRPPTGSSSTESATAPSSTSPWRRPSWSSASPADAGPMCRIAPLTPLQRRSG